MFQISQQCKLSLYNRGQYLGFLVLLWSTYTPKYLLKVIKNNCLYICPIKTSTYCKKPLLILWNGLFDLRPQSLFSKSYFLSPLNDPITPVLLSLHYGTSWNPVFLCLQMYNIEATD